MGNALRFLYGECCNPQSEGSIGPYGVPHATVGFSALSRDLFQFETNGQVPEGLNQYVESSKKTQANWYKKILAAWKEARPPPSNAEEAATLIVETLKRHHKVDVEGLLTFYGLPNPTAPVQVPTAGAPAQKWTEGLKYELHTLQVGAKDVADGDTINVYVDTKNAREAVNVPTSVQEAMIQRREARARRDYKTADALNKQITSAGYRVFDASSTGREDILAHKYRIRLRGVDAPESQMPYGKEAKQVLLNLVEGKSLRVLVYDQDRYGRTVGDIYSKGVFVQEVLLKKGCAWHYTAYDQRPELAMWEKEARAARVGLWASSNPQKPWEWRKNKRGGGG